MFESLSNAIQGVKDFFDPKATPGIVSDPMIELRLPARPGLGVLIEIDATSLVGSTSMGMGPALASPFVGALLPPIVTFKTVEDGKYSRRPISEEARHAIWEAMAAQVERFGEVQYIPDPTLNPKERV